MTLTLVTPAVRDQLERLARWSLNGTIDGRDLPHHLAKLSPLPEETALIWFADLCEGVAALAAPWFDVIPDATGIERDEQADDAATTRINLALDALTGAAS